MIVDWFRVICDLTKAGWSEGHIAAAIHVPKSTLVGWKQWIRIMDVAHAHGWRVAEAIEAKAAMNKTRARFHGGKKF